MNPTKLSNKTYDLAKRLVQVILPAFASLYFGLAALWGLPEPEKVMGTTALIATFIGVTLGISTKQYYADTSAYDGKLVIEPTTEGKSVYSLELNAAPEDLRAKDRIIFKVDELTTGFKVEEDEL